MKRILRNVSYVATAVLVACWLLTATYIYGADTEYFWSGAITDTSALVKAKLDTDGVIVRLAVDDDTEFTTPLFSQPDSSSMAENGRVVRLAIDGLMPSTQYYYRFELDGSLDSTVSGRFRTFPEDTATFTFAFASCATTGSNHPVFETIRQWNPLFFFHTGDFHYQNIGVNDIDVFRQAYETVLASPTQSALYRDVPIEYIWDDHDYGPNNSDSTAPGRLAARMAYQEIVPHYPLAAGEGNVPIYHTFDVGRVRFIVCDMRSARSPYAAPAGPSKTMMGVQQKEWFKQELLKADSSAALTVWVNSLPWIGTTGDDGWYLYTDERREIANFIRDNHIRRLCMISGDAHMLAIDDGTNSDYADGGGAGFPVMHAAALDRSGSFKGGPYSHGAYPGGGQFGLMTVHDSGDSLHVYWSGRNAQNTEIVSYDFAFSGVLQYECGDADHSGIVDHTDIIYLLNYIFLNGPSPNPLMATDCDCSDNVDIDDVVRLIRYIYFDEPLPCDYDGDGTPDCG